MILGRVDYNIVVPPRIVESSRIVVPPTIVEPPRRSILLLDGDVDGSDLAGLGGTILRKEIYIFISIHKQMFVLSSTRLKVKYLKII